ncbi:uncharacterized protein LOC132723125 isoform X2 [Ruditapes philippinarum]|uniref:uncharacterized protein LOC132723125 isoform X2 n=1 Tax=Ruditapes philippinarum TaxID=129788 RepID=UPI00295AF085|nr:uncharacterized protein LOC132723125 isoform X2 [Ruditapes philippinarum]
MADSVDEVIKVSKLLGFDYSKFENTRKSSVEKKKNAEESRSVRNKKILVSPARAYRPMGDCLKANTSNADRSVSKSRPAFEKGIIKTVSTERFTYSGRNSVDPEKLSVAQLRKSKSETKLRKVSISDEVDLGKAKSEVKCRKSTYEDNENLKSKSEVKSRKSSYEENEKVKSKSEVKSKKPISEKNHLKSKSEIKSNKFLSEDSDHRKNGRTKYSQDEKKIVKESDNEKPLREIRRRLDFENDEVVDEVAPLPSGLDFTDKIAALRSLMHKDREISDRKAYYGEYRSSQRKVIISRSDSLKENQEQVNEKFDPEKVKVRDSSKTKKLENERHRKVQSADLFRGKELDGRLSSLDMHILKERLEAKHEIVSDKKDNKLDIKDSSKVDELSDRYLKGNSLLHARKDRKIIVASARQVAGRENIIDKTEETRSRPSSTLEAKETQTNQLNQSIRSVQSNVPFYEPVTRPMSTPVLNCELSVSKRRVLAKSRDRGLVGIEPGINLKNNDVASPSRDERQTNVNNFVGTSLTPEKLKHKSSVKNVDRNKVLEENGETINRKRRSSEHSKHKYDAGNHRPSSRGSNRGEDILYMNGISGKTHGDSEILSQNNRLLDKLKDSKQEKINAKDASSKSERKVREWIKNQEKLMKGKYVDNDDDDMMMEELNVCISYPVGSPLQALKGLSNGSDREHGKLEKTRNDKSHTPSPKTAYGIIQPNCTSGDKRPLSRQDIFDRLEHITMAVTTQKHQLELEIPMKDVQVSQKSPTRRRSFTPDLQTIRNLQGKAADNWDSASTESSVFSLPFSIRSGESISSTCQAVKLLRKLYNVDTETRQNLVLMAKCFRRWFNNVLHAKARNFEITQAAKRVSPISYGVMLRKSDTCYRTNVLAYYFNVWKTASRNAGLHRQVELLHRRHTLQKGMNAFKWAINRSKLQQGMLQDRINIMLLQSIFTKWKYRTLENRRLRLQQAFFRWRQFTKEAQKIRMLRNQSNRRLKERVFLEWYDTYQQCLKQHKADMHARRGLLSQGWSSWRWFTVLSKEKKQRESLAVQLFQFTLQRKMFTYMKVEFSKYIVAKQFHKVSQLKVAMVAWRAGTQVSKAERAEDMRVAEVYWSRSALRAHFTAWRDSLLTNKACRMCDSNFTRNAFYTWKRRYEELVQRREAVDMYIRQKVQTRAFQHWYTFVVVMKQRRAAAVECLQSVLQRRMFERWHWFTICQRNLRKRALLHLRKHNLDTQRRYLSIWRSQFKVKCDEKKAQQLWSNSCARRAAESWRLVCHRRRLARLLIDTEPIRQLNTQRVYFLHWKSRFELILEEKQEASDVRAILDTSKLKLYFEKWQTDTRQRLLIKPMVLRYRQRLITQCFQGWRQYVVHKARCLKSEKSLLRVRLQNKFKAWRRQYEVHQIEKDLNKKRLQRSTHRCLQGWRFVIQRKHRAQQFHEKHLVKYTFIHWSTLALRKLREKRLQQMEMETVMGLLQKYFSLWKERLYSQQSTEEENVAYLQEKIETNRVKVAFYFWRRYFRATLIARENEKIQIRKLAKQALQSWYTFTQNSLQEAVEKFATAIGLRQDDEVACFDQDQQELDNISYDKTGDLLGRGDSIEMLNFDLETFHNSVTGTPRTPRTPKSMTPRTPRSMTPRTPHTPRTPRTPGFGTPMRRLHSPTPSHMSLAQSLEFDSGALTSSSFIDARFEMEHAVKIESRREIVVTVVNRLRHWPISIVFEQWKEYTARQSEFKLLTTKMISVHQELALKQYFNSWVQHHKEMKLAKHHYEEVLQHKALLSLILYRNMCREKKQMNTVARLHYARKVYSSIFPIWLAKAQEKQHAEKIVFLWTNITDEERQLIPRERSFCYKLNKKSLKECFTVWQNKYRKISKLKKVYHKILYQRYFGSWCNWALELHNRKVKCEQFRDNRRKKLVFKTWCLRHTQKKEVERRYEDTWHNYLVTILQSWQQWAHDQRRRKVIAAYVSGIRNKHLVCRMFVQWKTESEKHVRVTQWYQTRLSTRVLSAWQEVASWQKDLKQRQLQCQLMSYKALAKRALRQWYACYQQQLQVHEHHEQVLQRRVLRLGTHWRKKAQKTRGHKLHAQFQNNKMGRMFAKWKSAYRKNLDRYDILEKYRNQKNLQLTAVCLETWRTELMCIQAHRVFSMKLMITFLSNWKLAARGCCERRNALQKYTVKKEKQTQKVFFLYWYNVAKARKSIRGHANLKMQLTVFKSWLVYTRKKNNLRRLESAFTRKRNQGILQNHWYLVKTRFDYCVELSSMANRVIHEKNTTLMNQALQHWAFRLKIVIADECHEHILAKRTANRWRHFVLRRRQERQHMKEQTEKAVKFYNKHLCNKVYKSWFNEVLATRQAEKRKARLCRKYGLMWKHKTDMVYTAKCVRNENLCMSAWRVWHLEFVRRKTIKKVEAFEKKQQLTMVFVSWKNLCKKRSRKISMIPLPVSPAFSMPSAGSSGSSTPTDELYSPVLNKHSLPPTQIPIPNSVLKRKKSLSAKNSPTGSMEKLSSDKLSAHNTGRRGSIY